MQWKFTACHKTKFSHLNKISYFSDFLQYHFWSHLHLVSKVMFPICCAIETVSLGWFGIMKHRPQHHQFWCFNLVQIDKYQDAWFEHVKNERINAIQYVPYSMYVCVLEFRYYLIYSIGNRVLFSFHSLLYNLESFKWNRRSPKIFGLSSAEIISIKYATKSINWFE